MAAIFCFHGYATALLFIFVRVYSLAGRGDIRAWQGCEMGQIIDRIPLFDRINLRQVIPGATSNSIPQRGKFVSIYRMSQSRKPVLVFLSYSGWQKVSTKCSQFEDPPQFRITPMAPGIKWKSLCNSGIRSQAEWLFVRDRTSTSAGYLSGTQRFSHRLHVHGRCPGHQRLGLGLG